MIKNKTTGTIAHWVCNLPNGQVLVEVGNQLREWQAANCVDWITGKPHPYSLSDFDQETKQ